LIVGESGTGKELVAKAIHHNSTRADRAFVTVNSGSMPADLLESNLFGHVKGSFTGAIATKKGLFQVADQGTIFFDEIGTVGLEIQAKLLRVIQEREFMPVGGIKTQKVDVRILAATNVDLKEQVLAGSFREDLYYRLNVITIELPPLRERKDDIALLSAHFVQKYARENRREPPELAPAALQLLLGYEWPGNVRELENVIERAIVLGSGAEIGPELIPETLHSGALPNPVRAAFPASGLSFKEAVAEFENALLLKALGAAGGVQKRAAELLQLKPTTFNEMLKRHGIRERR
jgi:transcriptional regulator with GAF, ATPase, and Fis domain